MLRPRTPSKLPDPLCIDRPQFGCHTTLDLPFRGHPETEADKPPPEDPGHCAFGQIDCQTPFHVHLAQ